MDCIKMNNFYVYIYLDQRKIGNYKYGNITFEYEPFYVGKGKGKRAYKHLTENLYNPYFNNKIKKIQRELRNNPIIIKYAENLTETKSFELEKNLITTIGRLDLKKGPLCNLTNGGDGLSNPSYNIRKKISEKIKSKHLFYSERMVGDKNPAKKIEVRQKLSIIAKKRFLNGENPMSGKKHSIETKNKISEKAKINSKGINNPMYGRTGKNSPHSKKYKIKDNNGKVTTILCLKQWCVENNMIYSSVTASVRNHRPYKGYIINLV